MADPVTDRLVVTRGAAREYRDAATGETYYSVSQVRRVLYDPYAAANPVTLHAAADRGRRLHLRFALALGAAAGLCESPAPLPGEEAACAAMDRWLAEWAPLPVRIEEPAACPAHGFAGQPDALVRLRRKGVLALVDLKTGQPTPTDGVQLAAYAHLHGYTGAVRWLTLYVAPDGARERIWTRADLDRDWAAFLAALSVLRWRERHGLMVS